MFAVNECYYIYKDKYKYITVLDADEAIIPRQAYNQELNETFYKQYKKKDDDDDGNNKFISYLDQFNKNLKLKKNKSISFAFSFSNEIIYRMKASII